MSMSLYSGRGALSLHSGSLLSMLRTRFQLTSVTMLSPAQGCTIAGDFCFETTPRLTCQRPYAC